MNIRLNGNPHEIETEMSVLDFLASIGFGGKPCVVEVNEEAVFPRDYADCLIGEGSRIEIVTLAAGG
jgi:thiamine biosynthesis protein ThiS